MSTEQTEPTSHYGDDGHGVSSVAAPAQASVESSGQAAGGAGNSTRRRRRRRKGKGPGVAAAAANGQSAGEDGAAVPVSGVAPVATAPSAPQQQSNGQPSGSQQSPNYPQGGKRKNGRKRGGAPQPPAGSGQNRPRQGRQNGAWKARSEGADGNREGARGGFGSEPFQDNNGNGNGRRKGKFGRRGPTSFVGPMDHSYRAVNGNIADGPPSTLDYRNGNANGNVNGRNDSFDMEPALVQRADSPTRIICFIEDLFVVAKMQEAARKLGIKIQFSKAEKETLAAITEAPEAERPSLIVFDLNNGNAKPLSAIPKLKAKLKRGTSIIGFLQHIQGDLKLKAIEAGCDSVMPRSAFSQNLPNLLRRHGFDEAEDMVEA